MKNLKQMQSLLSKMEDIKEAFERLVKKEETGVESLQDSYDNKSEKWQESEKGDEMYQKIEKWNDEISAINDAIKGISPTTVGIGSYAAGVKGSPAYDMKSTLDTIGADAAFSELQKMRDNSPTGGALGSVAVEELKLLKAAKANIDQGQSGAQLKANLQKYQTVRRNALKRVADAFEKDNGYRPDFEMPSDKPKSKAIPASDYFK